METKQINIYDYDELTDEVKEKVLNDFRSRNDYYFLEECLTESLNALIKEHEINALTTPELRYSLNYSKGDGLSFIGDFEYKGIKFYLRLGSLSNYYSHSNTIDISREDEDEDENDITEEVKQVIEDEFKEIFFKICNQLEKEGYDFIEYEDSEEAIKEMIEANEYKFRENGEIEV